MLGQLFNNVLVQRLSNQPIKLLPLKSILSSLTSVANSCGEWSIISFSLRLILQGKRRNTTKRSRPHYLLCALNLVD